MKRGTVQAELKKLTISNLRQNKAQRLTKRQAPPNPECLRIKPIKELLGELGQDKVVVTWKDGTREEYSPDDILFWPEYQIPNASEEVKEVADMVLEAVKRIYLDTSGSAPIRTYETYCHAISELIGILKITSIEELEAKDTYDKYIITKSKPVIFRSGNVTQVANKGIKTKLNCLSAIISKFIKLEEEFNGFVFTKNRANLKRENFKVIEPTNHHISRTKEEVELWINSQESFKYQCMWYLYSLGLRNHEIRMYKVKDGTNGSVKIDGISYNGLRTSQIDWKNKRLINVKRKTKRGLGTFQNYICLDDIAITLLKTWLDYRKKFHPEIENDPILSQFVFDFRHQIYASYSSKSHFKRLNKIHAGLIKYRDRLKKNGDPVPLSTTKKIETMAKIIENGPVKPHQLRHTWDYLATKGGMRDYLRRYHLNHSLKGMDQVYVAPHITYEDYREEFDRAAPKFNILV